MPLFTSPAESGEAPLPAVAEWLAANIHDEQQPVGARQPLPYPALILPL